MVRGAGATKTEMLGSESLGVDSSLEERFRLLEGQNLGKAQSLEQATSQISGLLVKISELEAALHNSYEDIKLLDSEYKAILAQANLQAESLVDENQALATSLDEADHLVRNQMEQLETLMIRLTLSLAEIERLNSTQPIADPPVNAT